MNNSNSTGKSPENSPPWPEACPNRELAKENYEKVITATEVPQPSRYTIQIKGHQYCLTRNECIRLHQALLKVLPNQKESTLDTIILAVSRFLGVAVRDMKSHAKQDHIVVARYASIYLAAQFNVKRTELVDVFDRHYASITYALDHFEKRLAVQPKLKAKIDKLEAQLKELLE